MSKAYSLKNNFYIIPITQALGYELKYEKSVLKFGGCFGTGRYCENYKFKYYPNIANMKLIGYDEESFGNAVHDGAYTKSVNLLTNIIEIEEHAFNEKTEQEVVINKVSKKISTPIITIESFDEKTLTYLNELGRNYFKDK